MDNEKTLDRKLGKLIKFNGGICIKLATLHLTGLPDRLCLLPGGVVFFAEIKTPGEKPRKIQTYWARKLEGLGFKVFIVDNSVTLKQISNEIHNHR